MCMMYTCYLASAFAHYAMHLWPQDYAIRVPMFMMHKLPDFLHAFNNTGRVAKMQKAMECTWRLHWWRRDEGRAFEVVMCELKRRLLGKPMKLDTEKCELYCGDDRPVKIAEGYNNV